MVQVGLLKPLSKEPIDANYVVNTPDFMKWDKQRQIDFLSQKRGGKALSNLVFSRAQPLDKLYLVNLLRDELHEVTEIAVYL